MCLVLLAFLAVAQVMHVHASDSDADHCTLCLAMHSVVPLVIMLITVVLVRIEVLRRVFLKSAQSPDTSIRPSYTPLLLLAASASFRLNFSSIPPRTLRRARLLFSPNGRLRNGTMPRCIDDVAAIPRAARFSHSSAMTGGILCCSIATRFTAFFLSSSSSSALFYFLPRAATCRHSARHPYRPFRQRRGSQCTVSIWSTGRERFRSDRDHGRIFKAHSVFSNVTFNPYRISVSVKGFAPLNQGVEIRSSVGTNVKLTLQVTGASSTVTVQASGDLVEDDPTFHTDVDCHLSSHQGAGKLKASH